MLVVFVAPYFSENAKFFIRLLASQPGVRLGVVGQEDLGLLPPEVSAKVARYARVRDALTTNDIVAGVEQIRAAEGVPVHRLLGILEQLQVPLGEARERLDLPGMRGAQALNFRDKTRMKDLLRAAGVPVARHRLVKTTAGALDFAKEVGYPLVVKPPAGAASQTTFRATDEASLRAALGPTSIAADGVVLLEEFVTGEEHSYDAFVKNGEVLFYSVSNYMPAPLEVVENPWIQWRVVLPRDYQSDDIATAGKKTLEVLGLETGMCHLEWFRRADGSIVISEVGARPGGAQIPTLIARAHDVDCVGAWAKLVVFDTFEPFPERKYATGAAYLRGQGEGRVRAVHGLDVVKRDLGALITDERLPQINQEKSKSYEGEGFIVVRHPETARVEEALKHIVSTVRVELG
ncbi:MAG: ATP-grasp domain-containing protein [Polyangiaceae bacterium]